MDDGHHKLSVRILTSDKKAYFEPEIRIELSLNSHGVIHLKSDDDRWNYRNRLTEKMKANYQKVVVSTTLEQSYMFFLFYTKYDPVKYLASGGTRSGSFEEGNNHFDKYEFRKIDWAREKRDGTLLYVGDPKDMPHGNVGNISFLDGTPAIEIADRPNGAQ